MRWKVTAVLSIRELWPCAELGLGGRKQVDRPTIASETHLQLGYIAKDRERLLGAAAT